MSPEQPVTRPTIRKFQFPLTNGAFGFPRTRERRRKPFVLMCIHISGNKRTANMPVGIAKGSGTRAEVLFMSRNRHFGTDRAILGNSAHDYIARDGSVLSCIPTKFAAWNNGAVVRPNTKLESVKKIKQMQANGLNANEAYLREVECTGFPGKLALTDAQRETVSFLIARDSIRSGMSITRETVHLHADLDGVNRRHCPFAPSESRGSIEHQLSGIISRARQIKAVLKAGGEDQEPEPPPEPPEPPDDEPTEVEALEAQLEVAEGEIARLRSERRRMMRLIDRLAALQEGAEGADKVIDAEPDDDDEEGAGEGEDD
jgi:hypothetical protein